MKNFKTLKTTGIIIIDLIIISLYAFAMLCLILFYGFSGPEGSIIILHPFWLFIRNYIVPMLMYYLPLFGIYFNVYFYKKTRKKININSRWKILMITNIVLIVLLPISFIEL